MTHSRHSEVPLSEAGQVQDKAVRPPYVDSDRHKAMLNDQASLNGVLRLYLWASKAVETGAPGDELGLADAFAEMMALDEPGLFEAMAPISDMTRHNAQSAVSASAAVIARHADAELWFAASAQVIDVVRRASTMTEWRTSCPALAIVLPRHRPRGRHL